MSDLKSKLEEEIKALNDNFILLIDTRAENYFDVVMEAISLIIERDEKGVYLTSSRPYSFILKEMQKRNIKSEGIMFIDGISYMSGSMDCSNKKDCIFIENPAALEEMIMHLTPLINKIKSDKKFLIIDSISTLLIYNDAISLKKFSMSLTNMLRMNEMKGVLMVIEKEAPDELKQILMSMCDKTIHV